MSRNTPDTFWAKADRTGGGCWLWTGQRLPRPGHEYGRLSYGGRAWAAHRLAWTLEHGPIPGGMHVLHRCDNPPCVNPAHLFLGTNADNVADREAKGRRHAPRGEAHPRARLTIDQVREILATPDERPCVLGRRYGVDSSAITSIRKGRSWRHAAA